MRNATHTHSIAPRVPQQKRPPVSLAYVAHSSHTNKAAKNVQLHTHRYSIYTLVVRLCVYNQQYLLKKRHCFPNKTNRAGEVIMPEFRATNTFCHVYCWSARVTESARHGMGSGWCTRRRFMQAQHIHLLIAVRLPASVIAAQCGQSAWIILSHFISG